MRLIFLFPIAVILAIGGCDTNQSNRESLSKVRTQSDNWALLPFKKIDSINPVLKPSSGSFIDPILKKKVLWEEKDVFNPAIVNHNGKIYMLYRAQDKTGKPAGTSRIGLAVSSDAMHFSTMPKPVFYPDNDAYKKLEWQGGCEDPR